MITFVILTSSRELFLSWIARFELEAAIEDDVAEVPWRIWELREWDLRLE